MLAANPLQTPLGAIIGGYSPSYCEGPSFLESGEKAEGPESEAQSAESGVGSLDLGKGHASPSLTSYRGLGSAVSSPAGSGSKPRPLKCFLTF